jgi:uncharacterized membrane protein
VQNTHRTTVRLLASAAAVALCAGGACAQQARLYRVPDLEHPGAVRGSMFVKAVADNGNVVGAGTDVSARWWSFDDSSSAGIVYSPVTGESVGLGKFAGAFNSSGGWVVSADGSTVYGVSSTARSSAGQYNSRGFRWTLASGMTQLPIIPSDPEPTTFAGIRGATPDGSLLVGGCGTNTTYRWAVWPAGGEPYQFPDPVHTVFGELKAVSDDAQTMWGSGSQTGRALIWRAGAPALISVALPNAQSSDAIAMSTDGTTFIGNSDTVYQGQHYQHAFRYRDDTGVVDLNATFIPNTFHGAIGASGDGNIIVGSGNAITPPSVPFWQGYGAGWIWRPSAGTIALETYLTGELGLDLRGLVHPVANAVSRNGRWIAGTAIDPTENFSFGSQVAWLVDTGAPCYPNCDGSVVAPILNVQDFSCFLVKYVAGDPYANCDGSTAPPTLNVLDFSCFLQRFAEGCP